MDALSDELEWLMTSSMVMRMMMMMTMSGDCCKPQYYSCISRHQPPHAVK